MSEEPRPSTQPHHQRRNDGAPAWWALLDRGDLPDDTGGVRRRSAGRLASTPVAQPRRHRLRNWVFNVLALLVAVAVVMLGVGVDSARGAIAAALIFGVPLVLVFVTANIAAKRLP